MITPTLTKATDRIPVRLIHDGISDQDTARACRRYLVRLTCWRCECAVIGTGRALIHALRRFQAALSALLDSLIAGALGDFVCLGVIVGTGWLLLFWLNH